MQAKSILVGAILLWCAAATADAETVVEAWRSSDFGFVRAVAVNSTDGSCWLAAGEVVHLAADGTVLWRGGSFSNPESVSVNVSDGSCWVADTYNDQVVHLGVDGSELWRGGGFNTPRDVSVNPTDGSCWVADCDSDHVVHLAADGTVLTVRGGFAHPHAVSVNPVDGSCWVADRNHSQVVHLGADGAEIWRGDGFVGPRAVSANPTDGSCWVACGDVGERQVVHIAGDGTELWREWGFEAWGGAFCISVNLLDGSCWVADGYNDRVVHLAAESESPRLWSGDGFGYPTSLCVNPTDGSCWVAGNQYVVHLTIPAHFADVPYYHWALEEVEACFGAGIVSGYPDGTYQPTVAVTRDQMAVYIARALAGGEDSVPDGPTEPTFDDVPTDYWAYDHVEYCYGQNVVQGYSATTYAPAVEVTRDQMAVYVARALVAPTGEAALADYVPVDPRNFPDVPADFWSYKHVEYCVENGVVQGYEDGYYHPEYVVTRDQMAVYVARAFGLL